MSAQQLPFSVLGVGRVSTPGLTASEGPTAAAAWGAATQLQKQAQESRALMARKMLACVTCVDCRLASAGLSPGLTLEQRWDLVRQMREPRQPRGAGPLLTCSATPSA